jgi:hypothetical protein
MSQQEAVLLDIADGIARIQELWTHHQRATHRQHLLLAAGKIAAGNILPLTENGKAGKLAFESLFEFLGIDFWNALCANQQVIPDH